MNPQLLQLLAMLQQMTAAKLASDETTLALPSQAHPVRAEAGSSPRWVLREG